MNFALKPLALAMLVAASQFAGAADAPASKTTAAPLARSAPIATKAPDDWIIYDDTTYTPVVDAVSRHLDAARKAFDAKDNKTAAAEMRAVADELKLQAARAGREDLALEKGDKALLAADTKDAHDSSKRMNASASKVSAAAAAIESGKIKTQAELNRAIDKATRADMERRWLVSDVTAWYPVSEQPQRHFTDAVADYAKQDYKAAAGDVRKAISYLRLEANRSAGDAKQELHSSIVQLDKLAAAVEKGGMKEEQSMDRAFAKANHALALEHRSRAAESWARKEYDKAGYELKASAHGLESAAGWIGGEASTSASAAVADTRALGDKLASGATWTRDEIAKGFESLGNGINTLGRKISGTKVAATVHVDGA